MGPLTATLLSALRSATKPLSVREIATVIAEQYGVPYEKPTEVIAFENRVRMALKRRRQGVVSEWDGSAIVWRLDDEDDSKVTEHDS
jgi:hypothetical protein